MKTGPRSAALAGLGSEATRRPALGASGASGWATSGAAPRSFREDHERSSACAKRNLLGTDNVANQQALAVRENVA